MIVRYELEEILEYQKKGLTDNETRYYNRWNTLPEKFNLTYGKEYVVFGLNYNSYGDLELMIEDDTSVLYPKFYPVEFFSFIDERFSKCWLSNNLDEKYKNVKLKNVLISFEEAVQDEMFFENLIEGVITTQKVYLFYINKMKLEFSDISYPVSERIGDSWYTCINCGESNEYNDSNEKFKCSKCYTVQNKGEFGPR